MEDRNVKSRTAQGFNRKDSTGKLIEDGAHQTHTAAFFSKNESAIKPSKPKIKYPIVLHEKELDYLKTKYNYKIA